MSASGFNHCSLETTHSWQNVEGKKAQIESRSLLAMQQEKMQLPTKDCCYSTVTAKIHLALTLCWHYVLQNGQQTLQAVTVCNCSGNDHLQIISWFVKVTIRHISNVVAQQGPNGNHTKRNVKNYNPVGYNLIGLGFFGKTRNFLWLSVSKFEHLWL